MANRDLSELLQTLDAAPHRRGRQFEEVCRWYLLNDPVYRAQLKRVWLWDNWPGRWGDEAGIDLVAEAHAGQLWAIQAKAYQSEYSIKKSDIDTFLSESARSEFSYRLLMATTDKVARLAERTMRAQEKPVGQLLLHDLERAQVVWPRSVDDLRPAAPEGKQPRPHQAQAIDAVVHGFENADRGQLIMACGTGKTLVSLWISEALKAERTLLLVPSLSVLSQTIREWLLNTNREFEFLPVCSDDTVREHDQIVQSVAELGYPATGDPTEVAEFLARPGPRVVFSTYQSSPVIAMATKDNELAFDIAVADEAHRCAGPASSDFATILNDEQIRATKRLFMTATPRYFTGRVRRAGSESDFEIASMDDAARFGGVFHRLAFGDAIERDLLSDYRVLVIGVDDETYRGYAERGQFVTTDGKAITDARSLAAHIGVAKAIRKYNLRRTITFHSRVKAAKDFAAYLPAVIEWMPADTRPTGPVRADHIHGRMTASEREARLRQLRQLGENERRVVSNARCLAEGVDVPTLDGVVFIDPKRSEIDIIQAVGRAIRKAEDKQKGTIVIPVFIGEGEDAEATIESSEFKVIWGVVRALRDHDAELGEQLDEIRREMGRYSSSRARIPDKIELELPERVGEEFARAFEAKLVEGTTQSWESWYGLLERYVEREGDALVPRGYVEAGRKLGVWVTVQRVSQRRNRLAPERVERLEAVEGWEWFPYDAAWEKAYDCLQRYVEREGDALVPQGYVEAGFKLGMWVSGQRTSQRRNRLAPERVERLEAVEGWEWFPYDAAWEKAYDCLQRYVEREGNARVPTGHIEEGFKLGQWVSVQRVDHQSGRLRQDRFCRLEAVPGWVWDAIDAAWENGYAHLVCYVERVGNALVPGGHLEEGFKLGQWVTVQAALYREGKLDPERVGRLEELAGWVWDRRVEAWEKGYAHLVRYVERHGNALVPQRHVEDGFNLGFWVNQQRALYRRGQLDRERVNRLDELPGWNWNALLAAWENGYAHLVRYVEREGNALVPQRHVEDGFKLGSWVNNQRTRKDRLGADLVRRLDEIPGWVWNANDAAWENGYAHLVRYVEREGNALVPKGYVEDGFELGFWVDRQRAFYREGRLDPERIRRLEKVAGWVWKTRD